MNETEIEVSSPAYANMPQWNMAMRFVDEEWRLQCEHVIHDPIIFETFRDYREVTLRRARSRSRPAAVLRQVPNNML